MMEREQGAETPFLYLVHCLGNDTICIGQFGQLSAFGQSTPGIVEENGAPQSTRECSQHRTL